MKRSHAIYFIFLAGILTLLLSCGKKEEQLSGDNGPDQLLLEQRLQKSEAIKTHVSGVNHALRTLDALLGDIAKVLGSNNTIEGKPIDKTQTYLSLLQKLLKQSTEGLVKFDKDGSWYLDKTFSGLDEILKCHAIATHILGRAKSGTEELSVSIKGCSTNAEYHELLNIRIAGDNLDVVLSPESINHLSEQPIKADKCDIKIDKSRTEIHCRPIEMTHSGWRALLSPIDIVEEKAGLDANIKGQLWDPKGKEAVLVEYEQHPGQKAKLNVVVR